MNGRKYEIRATKSVLAYLKKHHISTDCFNQILLDSFSTKTRKAKISSKMFDGVSIELYVIKLSLKERAIFSYDWDAIHEINYINVYEVCTRDDITKAIKRITKRIEEEM